MMKKWITEFKILMDMFNMFLTLGIIYVTRGNSLLTIAMSIDMMVTAINFVITLLNRNVTDSQIVQSISELYNSSFVDRYIFYVLNEIFYFTICNFFWVSEIKWLYYSQLLLQIPYILNRILLSRLYKKIKQQKEHIIKIIVSKQIKSLIKFTSKLYLGRKVLVEHNEIMPLLENYHKTINYFKGIIEAFFVTIILSKTKDNISGFLMGAVKYFYNYKTGNVLKSYDKVSAEETIVNIFNKKQWEKLLDQNSYNALFYLLEIQEKTDIFKKIRTTIKFKLGVMSTIWSIGLFQIYFGLEHWAFILIPFMSFFIFIYRDYPVTLKGLIKEISIRSISIYFLRDNIFLSSLLSEFGAFMLYNKVTNSIYKSIKKETLKFINNIIKANGQYNLVVLITYFYVLLYSFFEKERSFIMLLHLFYVILINFDAKKTITYISLLLTGFLSEFNIWHISHNALLIYLLIPIYDVVELYLRNPVNRTLLYNSFFKRNKIVTYNPNITTTRVNKKIFTLPRDELLNNISIENNSEYSILEYNEVVIVENFYS